MPEGEIPTNAVRQLGSGYRRMSTPTHPTEGDFLSLKTEEMLFGFIFAFMAYKVWQNLRGLRAYWKYIRTPNSPMTDHDIEDDDAYDDEEEEEDRKFD
jgi:hypothetical protein